MKSGRLVSLVRDTTFYSVGLILRRGLGVVTLPVFARFLSSADFGIIAIVTTVRDLLTVVYEMGAPNSSARFYYDCRTDLERRRLFGSLFVFLLGSSMLCSALILAFGAPLWQAVVSDVPFTPMWCSRWPRWRCRAWEFSPARSFASPTAWRCS